MTPEPSSTESAVRRELLRLALRNSGRSVPLQLVAVAFIVYLGWHAEREVAAVATGILGLLTGIWRLFISRRYAGIDSSRQFWLAERELEGNSALAGAMWMVSTFGIYPELHGTDATAYVVIVCGSIAVAAFFMPLVGRSFPILTVLQLGSLALVSLMNKAVLFDSPGRSGDPFRCHRVAGIEGVREHRARGRYAIVSKPTRRTPRCSTPRNQPRRPTSPSRSSWRR